MIPEINIAITPESQRVLEQHAKRPQVLRSLLAGALKQGLEEAGAHLQDKYLRGGRVGEPRRGTPPLANRSGRLVASIQTRLDRPEQLSGFVGSAGNKYARILLGAEAVGITPKNAKNLWIPLKDNMTPGGVTRMSPREAMEVKTSKGKRALRIFKSKKGNLVAFMPGEVTRDEATGQSTAKSLGKFKRGANKGRTKGTLLFVLKKYVVVEGTDALAKAVDDKRQRIGELLTGAVNRLAAGGDMPGGGA